MMRKVKAKEKIKEFLQAWKDLDYKKMYGCTQKTWKSEHSIAELKKLFPKRIKQYSLQKITEVKPVVFDIKIALVQFGKTKRVVARLLCETDPYKPSEEGEFGVNPISIIKNLY